MLNMQTAERTARNKRRREKDGIIKGQIPTCISSLYISLPGTKCHSIFNISYMQCKILRRLDDDLFRAVKTMFAMFALFWA